MKTQRFCLSIAVLAGASLAPSAALAQNPFLGPDEASGVQSRVGNASPTAGFSTGETNSRIDDYFNQDEQINIDPNSGVVRVLRVNQKVLINDFITAYYPLKNVDPREIRDVMRTITGKEGGRAEVIRDKVRKENFVQVICPKFMLPMIEQTVAGLDVGWLKQDIDGSQSGRYYTKFRPAETIDAIASRFAGDGATKVDRFRNLVVRRDEPYRVKKYLEAAELIDVPPPQALLQVKIYEVDTSNDLKLGVDWIAWKNGPGRSLFEAIFSGQESHHRFDNATGFFDPNLGAVTIANNGSNSLHAESTQYLLSANYLLTSAYLDFLRVKGKARTLAEPEIYVFNAREASWSATDQFLSFDVTPDDPSALGIKPTRINGASDWAAHNRFLNHNIGAKNSLGLELNVFPVIGLESSEVELELISTELAGTTPQGTPIITSRRIVTKVRLVDGQPFVFGGLTRGECLKTNQKAPLLGDIPVLGYLFGQETSSSRRKELVVTVIPHFFQGAPKELSNAAILDYFTSADCCNLPEPPTNCFGFDMWLYDTVEKCSPCPPEDPAE